MGHYINIQNEHELDVYMQSVGRHDVLGREDELALARRYREHGDVDAFDRLVTANLRFVVKIAHEYTRYGAALQDLVQEGNIGLMVAVSRFEPERGLRLVSYAVWWIRAYIQNYILRTWSIVRIGTSQAQRKLFYKVRSAWEKMRYEGGGEAGLDDLAKHFKVDRKVVETMLSRMSSRDLYLNEPIGDDADGESRLDRIEDREPDQESALADLEQQSAARGAVNAALAELDERERYIVERRIMREDPETLAQIAGKLGISREWVRKLELRAKEKLREVLRATCERCREAGVCLLRAPDDCGAVAA